MINLVDFEIHTLSALLDYCTVEGGLDGYPNITGHLLHHMFDHQRVRPFYQDYNLSKTGIPIDPTTHVKVVMLDNSLPDLRWSKCIDNRWLTDTTELVEQLGTVARDDRGRLLLHLIHNDVDIGIDYSVDELEANTLTLVNILDTDQVFHEYDIDITWYWEDPKSIGTTIQNCGFTPIAEKVNEFCKQVAKQHSKYYNTVQHSFEVFESIIDKVSQPIELTYYETAIVHALLIRYYKPTRIKLIHTIPTNTDEFNIYT
jgi:hypothetical protein